MESQDPVLSWSQPQVEKENIDNKKIKQLKVTSSMKIMKKWSVENFSTTRSSSKIK